MTTSETTAHEAPAPPSGEVLGKVRARLAEVPLRLVIGGSLVASEDGGVMEAEDPSTGEVLAAVPCATPADVALAVEQGRAAQVEWGRIGGPGRREAINALGEVVARHAEELAMLDALNSGNPYPGMVHDVRRSIHQFQTWPAVAAMTGGDTIPIDPANLHFTEQVPYGVVVRISAFNHPAYFAIKALLPPLVAGNAVVLKPADQTPLSALRIGELAVGVLPPGVFQVLSGDGSTGDALVRHPAVKRIGFTGSVATGRLIQKRAAEVGVKSVSLELGGKNALVAFPDAPVEMVADAAVRGMNLDTCQGQSCGSTSRVFAHRAIRADLVEAIAERLKAIGVGPAYDPGTVMGPVVSGRHRERVAGYIHAGSDEGARLVAGGPEVPAGLPAGHYVAPTLFDQVDQSMRIAREEIFGPVISVLEWNDVEAMVDQVNAVDYGLTSSVWTNDLAMALRTARAMQSGYVWINDVSTHYWGLPFGGFKESGLGREECLTELQSYSEVRAVTVRTPWPSPLA